MKPAKFTLDEEDEMLALSAAIVQACAVAGLSDGQTMAALIRSIAISAVGTLPAKAAATDVTELADRLGKTLRRQIIGDHKYLRNGRRK